MSRSPSKKSPRAVVALALGSIAFAAVACSGSNSRPHGSSNESVAASSQPLASLSLRVVGNQLVDSNARAVRLLGVNRAGTEFKCIQSGTPGTLGWGIFDGPNDLASVKAIAAWHATAVRIPLNEDCWLGINGVNPTWSGAAYQTAIKTYVDTIHQAGLYAIVDLHWSAPGTAPAAAQQPMPDADHAIAFWQSVAATFASDQGVVFDLFNEPFLYGSYLQNPAGDPWACWLDGCGMNQYLTGGNPYTQSFAWNAVGMQTLVNTIRGVGASNPIMVAGLDWANDLSGWLAHKPRDPKNAVVAAWHSYPGEGCSTMPCWTSVIAPVAAQVPVVTGEIGDSVSSASTYVDSLLPWANAQGISYLGWTWNTWGDAANILVTDYGGTPTTNFGQKFHDSLVAASPASDAITSRAAVPDAGAIAAPPTAAGTTQPMPLISQGLPAYANYAQTPASSAVDADYGTAWRSGHVPTFADSNWLAVDLSALPAVQRTTVYSVWFNEYGYNYDTSNAQSYTLPGDYAIEGNSAPGGGQPPSTGWVMLTSTTGNLLSSGANLLSLGGYTWVRFDCTANASNSSSYNLDTSLQWNLYDAHAGNDGWKFGGDSITANSMGHKSTNDSFDQLVHLTKPNNPAFEMAGNGGWSAGTMLAAIDGYLADFPGQYFALSLGTNDAPGNDPVSYATAMSQLIDKILAAGKTPVIPMIPYTGEPAHATIPSYNAEIASLYVRYGSKLVHGPDLYTVIYNGRATMFDNQTDLHPNAVGNAAIRRAWAEAIATTIYAH